ncbi:MAG: hypothetical protein J1G01_05845 [Clostridiales bacterium]|nr:hypothetical protein [Clostridiales bacterium]
MKGKLLIVFKSTHGYVKRYVDILGNALGCDAVPADKLKAEYLGGYDKILFIGSVRGGQIAGFKRISDFLEGIYKKLTVCGVGMLPYSKEIAESIKSSTVSVMYEKFIPVFYAQGGFDFNELSRTEKMSMTMMVRQIKAGSVISEEGTFFLDAMHTPVDEVKQSNIQPLIDYLDDKTVDEKLYVPPEITDSEQEKQFFEEMEKAAAAPDNKKRALKKKLMK